MIKLLNKYFAVVMIILIVTTSYLYKIQINKFINNSVEHTFVISSDMTEENKEKLRNKMKNLTFQDVLIEQKENTVFVKMKFPPDKFSFFSKIICEYGSRREK